MQSKKEGVSSLVVIPGVRGVSASQTARGVYRNGYDVSVPTRPLGDPSSNDLSSSSLCSQEHRGQLEGTNM